MLLFNLFTCYLKWKVECFLPLYLRNADGDLGAYGTVKDAYMKQKHRMIWERRHGAIGTGMKGNILD